MLVEESAPSMCQLIALLPADVIKQDHSFKVLSTFVLMVVLLC